jgi:glycosyltransferase involved in cell wall biosynthesis
MNNTKRRVGAFLDSITYVSPRYPPYVGGVETHVSQLARRATKLFDAVSVITTDSSGHLASAERTSDGVFVYRLRAFAPEENYHFLPLSGLFKQLRKSNPQLLHIHSIHDVTGPMAGFMARDSEIIFTPHFVGRINSGLGRLLFPAYQSVVRRLIPRVGKIICTTHFEADLMARRFPESRTKIVIIPNGVDTEFRDEHRWMEPAEPRILYAGRLEKYKNVDKIIRAFSRLQEKHDSLRLTIVGRGPFKEELQRLASSLKLNGNTDWLEGLSRDELFTLYSSSSVVVIPSESESMGVAATEAIGVGTPTIVANASGLAEFVQEGLAQPIEPPVDDVKLAARIEEVLENPSSYSPSKTKSVLIKSWDEVAEATFNVYKSMIA